MQSIHSDILPRYKIGILLLDGFNSMSMHAFVDPFRTANYLKSAALYEWDFLSIDGASVRASNGLEVSGLRPCFAEKQKFDLIVINASWNVERFKQASLLNWLRETTLRGTILCGLDTGAFVLAYAGLLNGRKAAVHYEHIAAFRESFPSISVGEDLYVLDGDRITCCGGLASSDVALEIIKQQQGIELANASGRYIFHERLRDGGEGQLPNTREPVGFEVPQKLREAIILMERHLEQPMSIVDIARHVRLSQRQLDRLFKKHTGLTPVRYYLDTRLDRARGLITQTELPLVDVAIACGFGSSAQFSRTYKSRFGLSPSQDRVEGRVPFQFRSFPSYAGV